MSGTLIATAAGLVTALTWGSSDYLSAKSSQHHDAIDINFGVALTSFLMIGILFLFSGVHVHNLEQVIRISASSVMLSSAYLIFIKALSSGVVGIIVPLGNIYPLFTIILSLILIKTDVKLGQLVAMVAIVIGAAVLAYEKNQRKTPMRELHRETALALLAAMVWGVAFFVLDPVVSQVSWQTIGVISEITAFVFALLTLIVKHKSKTGQAIVKSLKTKGPLIIGIFGVTGTVAIYFGSNKAGSVLIPTVLSAGGPLFASFLAAAIDKERLGIMKRLGTVIVVAGIIVLNIT